MITNLQQFIQKTTCSEEFSQYNDIKFELNIASISDVHVGHPKNEATYIVNNLYTAFPDDHITGALDIILIAGDFFDRAMMLNDDMIQDIDSWILYILRICFKYDIMLIVLEGTPSHDRGQPERFKYLNQIAHINANVLYVNELSIKHIEKFGINVLFVPDECRPTTDEILSDVVAMMHAQGLSKVDYAFMHGTFDYQVPAVATCPKHNSDIYLSIVDKLIFIGHDHTASNKERIFVNGSFDRICHNDEIPKGHYRAKVRSSSDYEVTFIENKNSRVFKTITLPDMDAESSLALIDEITGKLPDRSYVRIEANKGHPILASMLMLEKRWPFIGFTKKELSEDEQKRETEKIDVRIYKPVEINKDNIEGLFRTAATARENVDFNIIELACRKLNELK